MHQDCPVGGRRRRTLMALLLVVGVAALTSNSGSAGAIEPGPPTAGDVQLRLWAAPDEVGALTATLVLAGVDMTPTHCLPPSAEDGLVVTRCSDLPDGTYDVVVNGLGPGHATNVQCTDIVASRATRPLIDVDNSFWSWSCDVDVGTPAVVLDTNVTSNELPDTVGLTLEGPTGADIECTPEQLPTPGAQRCRVSASGTYRAMATGVVPGFIPVVYCEARTGMPAGTLLTPTAEVSETAWLWLCTLDFAPPVVRVQLSGPAADLRDVALVVAGPDGDATATCVVDTDLGGENIGWACPFAVPGSYTISYVRPGSEPVLICSDVVVAETPTEPLGCDASLPFPEVEPTTASTPTEVTLPTTGGGSTLAVPAAALCLLGALAMWCARRRGHARLD